MTEPEKVNPVDFAPLVDMVNRQAVEIINLKQEVVGLRPARERMIFLIVILFRMLYLTQG